MWSIIEEYLSNSSSDNYRGLKLAECYEIEREGESKNFNKMSNRMLLWHGSRITNYVGILSQGLRIAPPEAPSTGYNFGKGVYFADMSSKSHCYCYPSNDTAIMLLAEVSIGTPNELHSFDYNAANLPKGTHSTKGCGRNVLSSTMKNKEGITIPCGKMTQAPTSGYLGHNEYIVYNTNQIRLRYLLKVKS
jgi:hypothetical protein